MKDNDIALLREAANLIYRIEAAGEMQYEGMNFERWKATARKLAPCLRAALAPGQHDGAAGEGHEPDCGLLYDDGPEVCTCKPSTEQAEIDYEVWQGDAFGDGDAMVAGSTSLADALHYAAVYGQDGPAWVVEVTRRPLPTPFGADALGDRL